MMRHATVYLLLATAMLTASSAEAKSKKRAKSKAEPIECQVSLDAADDSKKQGKNAQARDFYAACAVDSCFKTRAACQKGLEALPSKSSSIVVHLDGVDGKPNGLKIQIDDKEMPGATLDSPLELSSGEHTLRISAEGYAEEKISFTVSDTDTNKVVAVKLKSSSGKTAGGDSSSSSGKSDEAKSGKSGSSLPWVVAGTGAVVAGGGVVFLLLAPDMPSECDPDANPGLGAKKCLPGTSQDLKDQASKHDNFKLLGTGMLIGGGAALVGGVVWGLLSGGGSDTKEKEKGGGSLYGSPYFTPQGGGFRLGGTF